MKGKYVYRFVKQSGQVLYVGRTVDLESRIKSHKTTRTDKLFLEADTIQYKTYYTNTDMYIAELYYINTLKPKYNKASIDNMKCLIEINDYQDWEFYMNISDDRIKAKARELDAENKKLRNENSKLIKTVAELEEFILTYRTDSRARA